MEVTAIVKLRRMVLEHISRYTWNDELKERVYDILKEVTEDTPRYRCCVFKERAVLKNRITMAIGQKNGENIVDASKHTLSEPERTDLPIMDVLPAACDKCPIEAYYVTDACRHCITHKCVDNCPKKAIFIHQSRAVIDHDICVECGRCKQMCPYGAILEIRRPCVKACALKAVNIGADRKAVIDQDKCIFCGACRSACPFGAIDERSSIVRIIMEIKRGKNVIALVAPSITGQFGMKVETGQIYAALLKTGFSKVVEVAVGADITSVKEAEEYMEKVPAKQNFMASSCCPAFVRLVKLYLPDIAHKVSETDSPMVSCGKLVKKLHPDSVTVFIGPCIAKKFEIREHDCIDYAMTFEELACMMEGRDIKVEEMEKMEYERDGSKIGLAFPQFAGVTAAVDATVTALGGKVECTHYASGPAKCRDDLLAAEKGDIECTYFEGMSCANGCIDGPSVVGDFRITKVALNRYISTSPVEAAVDDKHTK